MTCYRLCVTFFITCHLFLISSETCYNITAGKGPGFKDAERTKVRPVHSPIPLVVSRHLPVVPEMQVIQTTPHNQSRPVIASLGTSRELRSIQPQLQDQQVAEHTLHTKLWNKSKSWPHKTLVIDIDTNKGDGITSKLRYCPLLISGRRRWGPNNDFYRSNMKHGFRVAWTK